MSLNIAQQDKYYTYEEYEALDDGNRYELHNGRLFMMAGVTRAHGIASGEIYGQLYDHLKGKTCEVHHSAYEVRLWEDEDTAYEPDVFVVCDPTKLKDKYCEGAPDFIAEVLSPSTSFNDKIIKFNDYRETGVKEYWIVDTVDKTVAAHRLIGKQYNTQYYSAKDKAPIQVLDGFLIDLSLVFRNAAKMDDTTV